MLSGSTSAKAACRMLVKLTPDFVSGSSLLNSAQFIFFSILFDKIIFPHSSFFKLPLKGIYSEPNPTKIAYLFMWLYDNKLVRLVIYNCERERESVRVIECFGILFYVFFENYFFVCPI